MMKKMPGVVFRKPLKGIFSFVMADRFIVAILVVSFIIGTTTHIMDTIRLGFLGYDKITGVSQSQNIFWTSLLVIDPLVVILLLTVRKMGARLALLVLSTDVLVNYRFLHYTLQIDVTEVSSFALQAGCLVFSAATLPWLLVGGKGEEKSCAILRRIYFAVLLLVFFCGVLIHVKGLSVLLSRQLTLWEIWVHSFMALFDGVVFYLIVKKYAVGRWIALAAFSVFAVIQVGYAAGNMFSQEIPFNLQMGIYLGICCFMIASLLISSENDRLVQ